IKVGLGISTDSERSLPLGVTFRECLVKYQGAYIDLPENVYFRQCLFVVTLGTPPNERRGFVSALLLAPDLNTVDDISR
ncbi:MAG: hypothetical protein ABSF62_23820, partial [Bryobacteraceae bacterium]